ncbi:helix-turn-helix domain-containing protein [Acuticoccus sp. M5D2P5]|uniref:IclR family transcriptional regulator n=1 Tax=Acuticoccus kalidii TaxID=2910977 RepID=UPI001F39D044|nr:IclR family transcriptional regulator C-terminal domain-containing protein [Acuticoccus kalidii]MCF3933861.1 helix-turn-helix domain-containing protein [Acuticoccus kalidii]
MSGRGAERILDLVEWLAEQTAPVGLNEAASRLDIPKSSTLLLLRILVDRAYVAREDGRYRLVRTPGDTANHGVAWATILRIAEPLLADAVSVAQESGFVAVLTPEQRVHYLVKLLPQREIRYDRDISGDRIPHQVASGMILLAGLSDAALEVYLASVPAFGDDPDTVRAKIHQARADGYAVNLVGRVEGAAGCAAPIRGHDGAIVAAINISGPRDRFTAHLDRSVKAAVDAARRASETLARRQANHKQPLGGRQ